MPAKPPREDAHGNAVTEPREATVRAEVVALDTDATVAANAEFVITRYRAVLAPTVDLPADVGAAVIHWGGVAYLVDGSVERHVLRGRLHHYEAILKRVT
ncbi:hypothetical protein ACN27E_09760 [Mycobacterium sp. WMMD1722]|uniref:hypothetical protein n=1 Tax=Mycobacterium sp. WMMD1722 TaxID=3404117 RepID=UPI003BF61C80